MKIKNPKTTILIFQNGKMVCLGASCETDAKLASMKAGKIIKNLGFKVWFSNFKIENIMATVDSKMLLSLTKLAKVLPDSFYEPEVFSGLVFRLHEPKITFIIHTNGKICMMGNKCITEAQSAYTKLFSILE